MTGITDSNYLLRYTGYVSLPERAPLQFCGSVPNPFVHALFGGAHASASLPTGVGSAGTSGFTMMMGGGADAKVSPHFAVHLFQADWIYYRFQGIGEKQNVRLSTGVVFRF